MKVVLLADSNTRPHPYQGWLEVWSYRAHEAISTLQPNGGQGCVTFWQGCVHFPHFSMAARAILCLLAVIYCARQARRPDLSICPMVVILELK